MRRHGITLLNKLHHGKAVVPDGRCVSDLARYAAGKFIADGKINLPW